MKEERMIFVEGNPYSIVISDEQKELLAAYKAGKAVIGVWNREKTGQSLYPAKFLVENYLDIDSQYLEQAVRRTFGMPWIIGETGRVMIREFTVSDIPEIEKTPLDTAQDRIFYTKEQLAAYISHQYSFYQYGMWALIEKGSKTLIGKAGLTQADINWKGASGSNPIETVESGRERLQLELGYHIFSPYRNMGYAKEACSWILEYAKNQLEAAVYAKIDASNEASIHLIQSLGFTQITQRYSEAAEGCYLYGWNY